MLWNDAAAKVCQNTFLHTHDPNSLFPFRVRSINSVPDVITILDGDGVALKLVCFFLIF